MTRNEVIAEAEALGFTPFFQEKIAQNTGRLFEVVYVQTRDGRELFAKDGGGSARGNFRLCNQFEKA